MSAVLSEAKQHYKKMLWAEMVFLIVLCLAFSVVRGYYAISLLVGGLVALVPQVILIYWVFFRKLPSNVNKMSVFYRGEGLKWLVTILLMVMVFKFFTSVHLVTFFTGYFMMLLCNSLLPFFFRRR